MELLSPVAPRVSALKAWVYFSNPHHLALVEQGSLGKLTIALTSRSTQGKSRPHGLYPSCPTPTQLPGSPTSLSRAHLSQNSLHGALAQTIQPGHSDGWTRVLLGLPKSAGERERGPPAPCPRVSRQASFMGVLPVQSHGLIFRRSPLLVDCSAVTVLEFLITFVEQGLHKWCGRSCGCGSSPAALQWFSYPFLPLLQFLLCWGGNDWLLFFSESSLKAQAAPVLVANSWPGQPRQPCVMG